MEALCLDFLNSDWRDYRGSGRHEDHLEQAAWVEGFLRRWDLPALSPPDGDTLESLRALRGRLRDLLERASAGGEIGDEDLRVLNRALGAADLRRRVTRGAAGPRLETATVRRDWAAVEAEIAASCVELISGHDPARIKFCRNPDCGWAFYDESRPGSRRWCEDACASLIKVRRFRARHREQEPPRRAPAGPA